MNSIHSRDFHLPDFFSSLDADSAQILEETLKQPVQKYLNRERKNFRADLVEVGFKLFSSTQENKNNIEILKDAIECLHAGSLIIDDIQDGSNVRRTKPSYHKLYGTPVSICVGNWMYFWPLRLLSKVQWSDEKRLLAYDFFHRTVEMAHYGQLLDLTVKSSQVELSRLAEVSLQTARLKSGYMVGLAMALGALLTDAPVDSVSKVYKAGIEFGFYLQRLDDWGNFFGFCDHEKRFEDLILHKPTTIWHDLLTHADQNEIADFNAAVIRLPDHTLIEHWMKTAKSPAKSIVQIKQDLENCLTKHISLLSLQDANSGLQKLKDVTKRITNAYV